MTDEHSTEGAPPPFLARWRNVYLLLLAELFVLVALFYLLGRWSS